MKVYYIMSNFSSHTGSLSSMYQQEVDNDPLNQST